MTPISTPLGNRMEKEMKTEMRYYCGACDTENDDYKQHSLECPSAEGYSVQEYVKKQVQENESLEFDDDIEDAFLNK